MTKRKTQPDPLERDVRPGTCGEAQPWNWLHACQLPPNHLSAHRVNVGTHDIVWPGPDGPVETIPTKSIPKGA